MKLKFLSIMIVLAVIGSAAYAVDVNGTIAQGEYARETSFDNGNFRLLWKIQGDAIFMAIDAKAAGWVAIGFEPTNIMANADMIFGIVDKSGRLQSIDARSTGMFGPHPPDLNQGGQDSILAAAAGRSQDRVVFEFSRKLNTSDKLDNVIPAKGSIKIIWAYSSGLQFTANHSKAGKATLVMDGSE
ncbi:MAG: DOMON domain-containing protein [Candidatus Hydrogenedentales bacterium]